MLNGIITRLSTNSSNIDIFSQFKQEYKAVIKKNSGDKARFVYKSWDEAANVRIRNNRAREIL